MKTLMVRSFFAVAALAVAAAGASAQTYTAQVPMAFQAGGKAMPAGAYRFHVSNNGGSAVITVLNATTASSAILLASPGADALKTWRAAGQPVMAFECLGSNCALARLWDGRDTATYKLPGLKVKPADVERLSSITVALTKGD